MPTFLQELLTQLRGIWGRLDGGQRATILTVLGAAIVGLAALVYVAQRPDYVTVHVTSDIRQLGEASAALQGAGFVFKTDGLSVQVSSSDYDAARSVLSGAGIVAGGDDDDLTPSMSDSEAVKNQKLFRGRIRSIERKLAAHSGIISATVQASQPKRRLYKVLDDQIPRTAAVSVRLAPGASPSTVAAFVLDSVQAGLEIPRGDISVFDSNGGRLGGGGSGAVSGMLSERELALARQKQHKAQEMLDISLPGQAKVTVNVEFDPRVTQLRAPYAGDTQVVASRRKVKNSSVDERPNFNGDPSTAAQTSPANGAAATGSPLRSTQKTDEDETKYAEPGEQRVIQTDHMIKRITASLVIDKDVPQIADAADATAKQAAAAKIGEMVKGAIGFDEARGDDLKIVFDVDLQEPAPAEPLASGPSFLDIAREWGPTLGQVVGVVVVLLFLRGLLKSANPRAAGASATAGGSSDGESAKPEPTAEELSRRMRREIERSIAEDPAAVSRLLEAWLAEQPA